MIDLVRELDALLVAWRARRSSEMSALIRELSSWFELVQPDLPGKTRTQRHAAWLARATSPSSIECARLLATLGGTHDQLTEQLEHVARWPADPRTTAMAKRLFQEKPVATSSGTQKAWRRLFEVIEHHADPRALLVIDEASMRKVFTTTDRGLAMRARAANIATAIAPVELTPDEQAAHAALVARIEPELASGRALRDAVRLEADDDDQPSRVVYLDWLIERGYAPLA